MSDEGTSLPQWQGKRSGVHFGGEAHAAAPGSMTKRKGQKDSGGKSRAEVTEGLAKLAEGDPAPRVPLGARLRNYFLTGLVVVGPVTITLYIARYVIESVDRFVKPYIPAIYNPTPTCRSRCRVSACCSRSSC